MEAQAPVHVANFQVGRGHRPLPSELNLLFSFNNKLFTNTDGESGHSWQPSTLVSRIFHVFRHVKSLRTRVWNWGQYITYLNATYETSLIYVWLLHAVFDYVRLFKCSISERSRALFASVNSPWMRKFSVFSHLANAVNSGYDRGERCLSPVFFAMLTCWHLEFSKIFAFLFFSIN